MLAALIGDLAVLGGGGAGAWLRGRREHERWLRTEKLTAAVHFISATGAIYDRRRSHGAAAVQPSSIHETAEWPRAQDARSAVYFLSETDTVDVAEPVAVESTKSVGTGRYRVRPD